jgi:hypothetical protein
MLARKLAEFGSTGSPEISTFHTLFAGNMGLQFGAPGSDPAKARQLRDKLISSNEQALFAQKDIVSFRGGVS